MRGQGWIAGLLAIGIAMGAGAQTGSDTGATWVKPGAPIAAGKAPGVKVQLLGRSGGQRSYAVIFAPGDEVLSGLTDFARQYHVTAAHFTAIGAVSAAKLAWFSPEQKAYKVTPIPGQAEVVAMIGDIAIYKGQPVVHTHMVVGLADGSTRGGHVIEATVSPTLEVMVTVEPKGLQKRLDEATGLTLIDPVTAP